MTGIVRKMALAFVFSSLNCAFACKGMEENNGLLRGAWVPPSASLPQQQPAALPQRIYETSTDGLRYRNLRHSETSEAYLRRADLERVFNERMRAVIKRLRQFFARSGDTATIGEGMSLVRQVLRELKESGLNSSEYLIREYRSRLLSADNQAQEDEWDAVLPQHTLLYYLVQLSSRYESQGPERLFSAFLTFISGLLGSGIETLFVSDPTLAVGISIIIFGVAFTFLFPRFVNHFSRPHFERELSFIHGEIRELYSALRDSDTLVDDETVALIKTLCTQNPRPRIIDELFSQFCEEEKATL